MDLPEFSAKESIVSYKLIEKIEVDSIDNVIRKNNLPRPDAIKVDIDGSEYAFLLGAKKSLKNAKSICIELFEESKYFDRMLEILSSHSYKLTKKYDISGEPNLYNYLFSK